MSTQTLNELLLAATECYQLNLTERAENLYAQALRINPRHAGALFNMGTLLLRRGVLKGDALVQDAFALDAGNEIDRNKAVHLLIQIYLAQAYKKHAQVWLEYAAIHQLEIPDFNALKKQIEIPAYLEKTIYSPAQKKQLERYSPIESNSYVYAIDIVGGCNLRCPTCPIGNKDGMAKGLMQKELFANILNKICMESGEYSPDIWLFNWSEPLLNERLPDYIKLIHSAQLTSFVSTNLNITHRINELMQANPTRLKVSISSLKQEIYGITHERGNINTVIANFETLALARDRNKSTTDIWIGHHLYKNTAEEMEQIQALANQFGFGYRPSYAIMAPIEKALSLIEKGDEKPSGIEAQLFFHPNSIVKNVKPKRSGNMDCELRFNMTAINYDGSVSLCCGTTQDLSEKANEKIYFMEHTTSKIEALKYQHSFCTVCIRNNLHLTIQDL
ncbi:molybdenum cofactor biosynthesis enzyme MoaA [Polynucleobacter sphagniphilus]|jgi:MoaA/NifB/PqqE/SkfB family radical SAM enzyme|uniref:radical SAM protein n=2 Tax=Polynucleobacter sphagniphilus TaxID=1743169 RepID=UPI0024750A4F|nr:radical SAM protein [Polynucleobacter sphagniphilus]MDH6240281.1 molybdenum cofactor biosynthesis enzyme MoaA [Polynucleobacter sphagniphilus]MDH6298891.1 molybdenum cofactor biosynthesis enzyme MoaA [Polynucleobacter sphagniphilus]